MPRPDLKSESVAGQTPPYFAENRILIFLRTNFFILEYTWELVSYGIGLGYTFGRRPGAVGLNFGLHHSRDNI